MGRSGIDETRNPRGLADWPVAVPLTDFQRITPARLAENRSPDSYLAGVLPQPVEQ